MTDLVVIGSTEFLPGFALAGVHKSVLANDQNVLEKINEHKDAGIIILEEKLTQGMSFVQRETLETSLKPVIITLSKDGTRQQERLRRNIMNTLGVDLLK